MHHVTAFFAYMQDTCNSGSLKKLACGNYVASWKFSSELLSAVLKRLQFFVKKVNINQSMFYKLFVVCSSEIKYPLFGAKRLILYQK